LRAKNEHLSQEDANLAKGEGRLLGLNTGPLFYKDGGFPFFESQMNFYTQIYTFYLIVNDQIY
jgi:hypothetical protein